MIPCDHTQTSGKPFYDTINSIVCVEEKKHWVAWTGYYVHIEVGSWAATLARTSPGGKVYGEKVVCAHKEACFSSFLCR